MDGIWMLWDMTPTQTSCTIKKEKFLNNTTFVLIWSLVLYPAIAVLVQCFSASLRNTWRHRLFQSSQSDLASLPIQLCGEILSIPWFAPEAIRPARFKQPWPPIQHLDVPIWVSWIVYRAAKQPLYTLSALGLLSLSTHKRSHMWLPLHSVHYPILVIQWHIWAMMGTHVKPSFLRVFPHPYIGHHFPMGCSPSHRVDPAWVMHNRPRYGWRCRDPNNYDLGQLGLAAKVLKDKSKQ